MPPRNIHSAASKKASAPPAKKAKAAKSQPPKSKAATQGNKRQRASSTELDEVSTVETRCTNRKKNGEPSCPPMKRTRKHPGLTEMTDVEVDDRDESNCEVDMVNDDDEVEDGIDVDNIEV
jgi:hypothetical protein